MSSSSSFSRRRRREEEKWSLEGGRTRGIGLDWDFDGGRRGDDQGKELLGGEFCSLVARMGEGLTAPFLLTNQRQAEKSSSTAKPHAPMFYSRSCLNRGNEIYSSHVGTSLQA